MISCKSKKSGRRILQNILPCIEKKLFLKMNMKETEAAYVGKVKSLGFPFYRQKSGIRLRVNPKAIAKMNSKIKEYIARSNGWGNKYRLDEVKGYIRGWINYFKISDMKALLKQTDEWIL